MKNKQEARNNERNGFIFPMLNIETAEEVDGKLSGKYGMS